MKPILAGALAWAAVVGCVFLVYWTGGGDFERGFALGGATYLALGLGLGVGMFAFLVAKGGL
jgi:hypothetical protein